MKKKPKAKTILLTCACCGAETRGRQWHNQDKGFGLCASCIPYVKKHQAFEGEVHHSYGDRGQNVDVSDA